jgi:hypothetical protein
MTRKKLIEKTIENISRLPDQKVKEIKDFSEFLLSKLDEKIISEGIQELALKSNSYSFLEEEENVYTVEDLKERYK